MKIKYVIITILLCLQSSLYSDISLPGKGKKIVVFTDYEADDCVAIALLLQYLQINKVSDSRDVMFDILLANQYRKKALVQHIVNLFGFSIDTVYTGSGGIKEPFEEEGINILSADSLQQFLLVDQQRSHDDAMTVYPDDEAILQFRKLLEHAEPNSIDVLILTNPIDFVKALGGNSELVFKINTIYMMGGWFANKPSFNWGMHMESTLQFFDLMRQVKDSPHSPSAVIFSSHFFAREFNGYVSHGKFPKIIEAFDANEHPVVMHIRNMVKNWDDSMTVIKDYHTHDQAAWRLEMIERIGSENIGRQFAPADPATMVGYLYPEEFIIDKKPVNIVFNTSESSRAVSVNCYEDPSSNVYIVEKANLAFFNDTLVALMMIS